MQHPVRTLTQHLYFFAIFKKMYFFLRLQLIIYVNDPAFLFYLFYFVKKHIKRRNYMNSHIIKSLCKCKRGGRY